MKKSIFILLLSFAQGQWTGETGSLVLENRIEIGFFSPFKMRLKSGNELSINKFLLMPNISIKQKRPNIQNWFMFQRFQLEYPTQGMKWLQSPLGKKLGDPNMFALISPQFKIPHMLSLYGELIGTKSLGENGTITMNFGLGIALNNEGLSKEGTIDLPIIFPRLSVYYNGLILKLGGEYIYQANSLWSYLVDYDMFFMPGGIGRYAFEQKGMLIWSKNEKLRILAGYKLIAGEYPFGGQSHLLPAIDVQFGL